MTNESALFMDLNEIRLKAVSMADKVYEILELVERYRKEHAERVVQGDCTPMGANMYFDMPDFTGNLARHTSNTAKLG